MEKVQINYRYENKYLIPIEDIYDLKKRLLLNGYKIKHRPNIINNIYFDVEDRSLIENIEGERVRKKNRLRWYGDFHEIKQPTLELKIKKGNLGKKNRFKIKQDFKLENLDQIVKYINDRFHNNNSRTLNPKTINRYHRDYYVFGNHRITLDSNLTYFVPHNLKIKKTERIGVVEIKYSNENNENKKILQLFNLKLSKYSKFVNGNNFSKLYL